MVLVTARVYGAGMASIVLRFRLTSGDHIDLTYEDPDLADEAEVVDQAVAALGQDSGVLRCRHGDRLNVLYGRGVAALGVSPSGAVL
ncbi:hypothetical protein BH24ACT15_BH24ACT15_37940 [soil metagenome]